MRLFLDVITFIALWALGITYWLDGEAGIAALCFISASLVSRISAVDA